MCLNSSVFHTSFSSLPFVFPILWFVIQQGKASLFGQTCTCIQGNIHFVFQPLKSLGANSSNRLIVFIGSGGNSFKLALYSSSATLSSATTVYATNPGGGANT